MHPRYIRARRADPGHFSLGKAAVTRDMTRREFNAALRRRGFRKVLCWIDIGGGVNVCLVLRRKGRRGWQTDLRASLAYAIREAARRDRHPSEYLEESAL